MQNAPSLQLTNGVRVVNFSSPHEFNFASGEILAACDPDRARDLAMTRTEEARPWPGLLGISAIVPRFQLSTAVVEELEKLQQDAAVDVILVPFPLLEAIRAEGMYERYTKAATICLADRVTKAIHTDRFCR